MSVSVYQKNYLADKKPFFKHFYPKDVAILAVRTGAMQGLLIFNAYVASLDLEEEEDDEDDDGFEDVDKKPEFSPPSPEEFTRACSKSFFKSLSITTYTRSLEEVALIYFRPQIVGKLVKDISKSATRKYFRTSSRLMSAALMLKTGMRASLLGHLAIFLVEETQQLVVILYRKFTTKKGGKKGSKKGGKHLRDGDSEDAELSTPSQSFAQLTLRNASRSGLAVITSGIGAAIGTFVRPGLGTVIGGTLGDTVAYVL